MKKLFFLAAILLPFLPGLAHADRLGGMKSSADVPLSTQTIKNTSTVESKTFHVTSGTVAGPFAARQIDLFDPDIGTPARFLSSSGALRINFSTTSSFSDMYQIAEFSRNSPLDGWQLELGDADIHRRGILSLRTEIGHYQLIYGDGDGLVLEAFNGLTPSKLTIYRSTLAFVVGGTNVATWDNDGFRSAYSIIANGTIGSNLGSFNIAGTTLTFDEPPIDTVDRIPVLNNGAVSWPEMAQGADLRSTQTFSGYNSFTSTSGVAVSYGVVAGSVTANDLTASRLVASDANKKLASVAVTDDAVLVMNGTTYELKGLPDCDHATNSKLLYDQTTNAFSCGTDQSGGAGSGDNMGTHVATKTVDMGGNNITNLSSITWSNGGWITGPSSFTYLAADIAVGASTWTIPGLTFTLAANSTYTFTGSFVFASPSSNSGGLRFACTGPAQTVSYRLTAIGGTSAASTGNFALSTTVLGTVIGTSIGSATSQTWHVPFTASIVTGATAGTFSFAAANQNPSGTVTFRAFNTHAIGHKAVQ